MRRTRPILAWRGRGAKDATSHEKAGVEATQTGKRRREQMMKKKRKRKQTSGRPMQETPTKMPRRTRA